MLDIVITSFITLVYHIIPGFQCNNSTAATIEDRATEDKQISYGWKILFVWCC